MDMTNVHEFLQQHQDFLKKNKNRDEDYVLDLCDEVLGEKASR